MDIYKHIETPAILIDEEIARNNIMAYQAYCDKLGLSLRPHIKTHKLPHFAQMQISVGAQGITCQKIGEAEVMADAGINDILITFNILGASKLARLQSLADRIDRLSVVADNETVVMALAGAFKDRAKPLEVLVECDTGANRCGVMTPDAAMHLASLIDGMTGLHFGGLMTYPPVDGANAVDQFMSAARKMILEKGITCPKISGGGSPDMWHVERTETVTEYRIGTYIYNDRSLVERGTCTWDDCALSVLATIVSTPEPGRAVVDAGSKALAADLLGLQGHGHVLGRPDASIVALSEEHGVIHHDPAHPFRVGQLIRIIPNHVCVISNLFDTAWLKNAVGELREITISARGKVV